MGVIMPEFTSSCPSPIGDIRLVTNGQALTYLDWEPTNKNDSHPILQQAKDELTAYFAGKLKEFRVPLHLEGSNFRMTAWAALRKIPFGQTRTYKEQAVAVGNKNAARAVGTANGCNPIAIIVPCHRIVGATGLGGFSSGIERKEWLLNHEKK